ncbi:hypothetical protein [Draconibacterium sediminis]|uniref:Uncharacterized protein n=1 Tax=Draconibacterium sediminis TaxID=1544798 RepID=A0A0D8JBC0_9BACT|nr:hypothetical protein [Draconibacterium sediminis]KJF44270.1 hypothetical protein LH29_01775 [Draconibacterium sediminis]
MNLNDVLANLYEMDWLYDQPFSLELYNNGAYVLLFLSALAPSFIFMAIFYFLIKYPFCKWYHWLIVLIAGLIVTDVLTQRVLYNFLAVPIANSAQGINSFLLKQILLNSFLSLLFGFIATLIFKRAPLPQHNIPWSKS